MRDDMVDLTRYIGVLGLLLLIALSQCDLPTTPTPIPTVTPTYDIRINGTYYYCDDYSREDGETVLVGCRGYLGKTLIFQDEDVITLLVTKN